MNVYEQCSVLSNECFMLRLVEERDAEGLLKVYGDPEAKRLFNRDNCCGGFHFTTLEQVKEVIAAWRRAYEQRAFVRWSIIDRATLEAIGTAELFHRNSNDTFDHVGLLRIDLRSDYEQEEYLLSILSLIEMHAYDLFECSRIITKAVAQAKQRRSALRKLGFAESPEMLVGHDGTQYGYYFEKTNWEKAKMDVYQNCPAVENERYVMRLVSRDDCADLLKVYSDPKAVPLFNSDNCNGDDFYYQTAERMAQAIDFWLFSYEHRYFVRWSVIDRRTGEAIGTVELFRRDAEDAFTNTGLLRLDLRSDYEQAQSIADILSLIMKYAFEWFGCESVTTKAVPLAVERRKVLSQMGFVESAEKLKGHDGTEYDSYWVSQKACIYA